MIARTAPSRAVAVAVAGAALSGCGGASPPRRHHHTPRAQPAELLSVPAVVRIYGRCRPGDRRWTVTLVDSGTATDAITYRVGSGQRHRLTLDPGSQPLILRLAPNAAATREPALPAGHLPATTLRTTAPLVLEITQGTEPHIYRLNVRFALGAAIGDTSNCALIAARLAAATYYPGGQPPA